jgi:uncharacterized membrane protein
MITKWNFGLFKVILILCSGIVLGGFIALLSTNNTSPLGGWLGIAAMLLLFISVVVGSRVKDSKK